MRWPWMSWKRKRDTEDHFHFIHFLAENRWRHTFFMSSGWVLLKSWHCTSSQSQKCNHCLLMHCRWWWWWWWWWWRLAIGTDAVMYFITMLYNNDLILVLLLCTVMYKSQRTNIYQKVVKLYKSNYINKCFLWWKTCSSKTQSEFI